MMAGAATADVLTNTGSGEIAMRVVLPVLIVGAMGFAIPANAQVAVVEEVSSRTANVEFMDYVSSGMVIKLASQDRLVLGYMKSCVREAITGGVIVVGTDRSDVTLGDVNRTQVACDAGQTKAIAKQSAQVAGVIVRSLGGSGGSGGAPQPDITVFGLSPIFELGGQGTLLLSRIDQPAQTIALPITSDQQLARNAFFDLST